RRGRGPAGGARAPGGTRRRAPRRERTRRPRDGRRRLRCGSRKCSRAPTLPARCGTRSPRSCAPVSADARAAARDLMESSVPAGSPPCAPCGGVDRKEPTMELSTPVIIGIVALVLVVLIVLIIVGVLSSRRRKARQQEADRRRAAELREQAQ